MSQLTLALHQFLETCALKEFNTKTEFLKVSKIPDYTGRINPSGRVIGVYQNDKLLFIIKIYSSDTYDPKIISQIANEGIFLRRLNLKESDISLPFAVNQCIENSVTYDIMGFKAAKGESLIHFLEKGLIDNAEQGIRNSARALAEIHLKGREPSNSLSPTYHYHEEHALRYFKKMASQKPDIFPLDAKIIEEKFFRLRSEIELLPSPTGWIHGDAIIRHFFYESATDRITIIDLDRFVFSILSDKVRGGPIGYDYAVFMSSLHQYAIYFGLETPVIHRLETAFISVYKQQVGIYFPSEPSIQYYTFVYILKKACLTAQRLAENMDTPQVVLKQKKMFQYLIDFLNT